MDAAATIRRYHEATKHHLNAYARGPGHLDWATQPDPFRRYAGADVLSLLHVAPDAAPPDAGPPYDAPFTQGAVAPAPVDLKGVSRLFYDSLALSAWKEAGFARWALRVNPSSGNLHPTEGYLACGPVPGLCDGPIVAHYAPAAHALEVRHRVAPDAWARLTAELPRGTLLVGLTSVLWREVWKYGERAFRYCQHDAGHAVAAIALAASALGWRTRLLMDLGDDEVAALLGIADPHGAEAEHPDAVLAVSPGESVEASRLPAEALAQAAAGEWLGVPNALSPRHVPWEAVDAAAAATRKPPSNEGYSNAARPAGEAAPHDPNPRDLRFRRVAHRRRSAVAMDGVTGTDRATFLAILERTLPGSGRVPFCALPWAPAIHLGLFVHRVEGLAPGLYVLARDPARVGFLKEVMAEPAFLWRAVEGTDLSVYLLVEDDVRQLAGVLSCHQQIASHGAFALGMLAEFEGRLAQAGPWFYRHLFWEAGAVGQVLYLEAEAAGLSATGIGCYFDDPVHRSFGITCSDTGGIADTRLQSLYHFTVGGGVDDPRIASRPAYPTGSP
jgi:SagB-type dehydrogenase family enzyme